MQRGAQDRPHLCSENAVNGQREPDGAKTQRGIAFGFESVEAQFVSAQVEGADDRAVFAAGVGQEFVGVVLFILGRQAGSRLRVEELRAIKPHAGGVESLQCLDLLDQLDVRAQFDLAPVAGDRRQVALLDVMELLLGLALAKLHVKTQRLWQRVYDDRAGRAVNDDGFARSDARGDVAHSDHGRDVDAARDDRSVRGPSAGGGDEAEHAMWVQVGGDRRQQVVGDNDRTFGQLAKVARLGAGEYFDQSVRDVHHIRSAFAQVIVSDLRVNAQQVVRRVAHGPFGVDAVVADAVLDLPSQVPILEHHQVGFEDVGALGTESLAEPRHRLVNLALGDADRLAEPLDLGFDLVFRNEHPHDSTARVVNQKRGADRDALTDAYAFISVFGDFPR